MFSRTHIAIPILFVLMMAPNFGRAQAIEHPLGTFYKHEINGGREPIKFLHLRESDVVWESIIWRTIDLHEKFNQFFFYPTEPEGSQGLLNFTYLIWNAAKNNLIPIYEDDEFKIPIENDYYFGRYEKGDTVQLEIYDDEEGEEFHYETVVVPKIFYSEDITRYDIKEAWYIDKQTTGEYVRLLGLAMIKDNYRTVDGEEEYMGSFPLFWIPFESMQLRRLLVQNEAYYEDNIAHLPSWDYIFHTHTYSSFIIRESNRFNRKISDYYTGEDAIWESNRIEDRLLDIDQDMWEF